MIVDLFLFRHGETNYNKYNIWQGSKIDAPLNEKGKKQALELRKKLNSLDLEIIFSSPMQRALQTAELANPQKLSIVLYNDLRETNFGEAEGLTMEKVEEVFPNIYEKFLTPTTKTWDIKFPGADSESKHDVYNRSSAVLSSIAEKKIFKRIGVACHTGIISAFCCALSIQNFTISNCCILHLQYNTETKTFEYIP